MKKFPGFDIFNGFFVYITHIIKAQKVKNIDLVSATGIYFEWST